MRKFLPLALLVGPLAAQAEPPFAPKLIRGTVLRPTGLAVELRVPSQWNPTPSQLNGMGVLLFQVPGTTGRALVFGNVLPLSPQLAHLPLATLLTQAVPLLAGQVPTQPIVGPETFTVAGRPAGRIVVGATIPSPMGPKRVEVYIGTVLFGEWAHAVSGVYEADLANTIRPGLDTMLATLKGEAPPRNTQLEQRIVGCWERGDYQRSSSSSSGWSSYLRLYPNGSYARQSGGMITSTGADVASSGSYDSSSQGTFRIVGNVIFFTDQNGQTHTNAIAADRGLLLLDNVRWIPCT